MLSVKGVPFSKKLSEVASDLGIFQELDGFHYSPTPQILKNEQAASCRVKPPSVVFEVMECLENPRICNMKFEGGFWKMIQGRLLEDCRNSSD